MGISTLDGNSMDIVQKVRQNGRTMRKLPHPDETWLFRDTDITKQEFQMLVANDLVTPAPSKTTVYEEYGLSEVDRWHTDPVVWDIMERLNIRDKPERGPTCPECGFGSFINQGDALECKECGAHSSKDAWRE